MMGIAAYGSWLGQAADCTISAQCVSGGWSGLGGRRCPVGRKVWGSSTQEQQTEKEKARCLKGEASTILRMYSNHQSKQVP